MGEWLWLKLTANRSMKSSCFQILIWSRHLCANMASARCPPCLRVAGLVRSRQKLSCSSPSEMAMSLWCLTLSTVSVPVSIFLADSTCRVRGALAAGRDLWSAVQLIIRWAIKEPQCHDWITVNSNLYCFFFCFCCSTTNRPIDDTRDIAIILSHTEEADAFSTFD